LNLWPRRYGRTVRYDMRPHPRPQFLVKRLLWGAVCMLLSFTVAWVIFKAVVNR
jgi:hypothetical protein